MFDTLSLASPALYGADLDRLLSRLESDSVREGTLSTQASQHTGRQGLLHVKASPRGAMVTYSVPKLVHGSNVIRATRADTERSIEAVSDALGLNFSEGKVTRLDLADTWATRHPVSCYLDLIGQPRNFSLARYSDVKGGQTLRLERRTARAWFEVTLYDKRAEAVAHGHTLPAAYAFLPYLLRPEVRLRKGVNPQLSKLAPDMPCPLTAGHLIDPRFYSRLLDLWANCLVSLPTFKKPCLTLPHLETPSELTKQLASIGLQAVGSGSIELMIATHPNLRKDQRKALRQACRGLAARPVQVEPSELIEEFREHVRVSVEACR